MKIEVMKTSEELGSIASAYCADILNREIAKKGKARIVLSTGASQFDLFKALLKENVDWSKVEMFHLDEYINLPITHPASFRKYLSERFTSQINLKAVHFVDGEGDIRQNIAKLTEEIRKEPIDLGVIGIGENGHIAFNDPPADFSTQEAYIIVKLDEACKQQQVREGWFPTLNDVPKEAISMSVHQIMKCKAIVSFVPYKVKANAIKQTLENELNPMVPATILKTHENIRLYLDDESASTADKNILEKYKG